MPLDLDTSKLNQATRRKAAPHDNCIVLDLGTGAFPRDIEVRLPDDDGARQIAVWDGSLNLAINDEVLCTEYGGNPKWRILAMGGADSGAGKVRVSEVWDSDFGDVAFEAGTVNLTVRGTRTLTIPTDLIHAADPDTLLSFTDDDAEIFAGGLSMLKLTEAAQDVVRIGPGSGDVDINFNGDMFLQGSNGFLGIGTTPSFVIDVATNANSAQRLVLRNSNAGASAQILIQAINDNSKSYQAGVTSSGHANPDLVFFQANGANLEIRTVSSTGEIIFVGGSAGSAEIARMKSDGTVGIGTNSPDTRLDIDAGAMEFAEMTAPAAGAANTARLFARDDGDGVTELCARFSSGLIQVLAPLQFGGISVEANATPTTITTAGTKVQITIFDTNEAANGAVPDHTNDHITVSKNGTYMVMCSITAESVAGLGAKFHFEAYKNNGATHLSGVHTSRQLAGGGGDTGAIPMSGPVVLAAGDTVEAWVTNVTNTQNIVIEDINLAIFMIGVNA